MYLIIEASRYKYLVIETSRYMYLVIETSRYTYLAIETSRYMHLLIETSRYMYLVTETPRYILSLRHPDISCHWAIRIHFATEMWQIYTPIPAVWHSHTSRQCDIHIRLGRMTFMERHLASFEFMVAGYKSDLYNSVKDSCDGFELSTSESSKGIGSHPFHTSCDWDIGIYFSLRHWDTPCHWDIQTYLVFQASRCILALKRKPSSTPSSLWKQANRHQTMTSVQSISFMPLAY